MFLFKIPPEKKETTGAENELLGLCRFLSLFFGRGMNNGSQQKAAG
ncbi:hypothetical protein LQT17_00010 [Escherichia coli]|nr:hypothetical protein LQT17_00010 [Escherichia coli]